MNNMALDIFLYGKSSEPYLLKKKELSPVMKKTLKVIEEGHSLAKCCSLLGLSYSAFNSRRAILRGEGHIK